uniref:Zinc transporter ZIP13 n=1 Tax=Denticeps clupeoides TaxID=299321 RepID=A0AAY4C0Y7_9TELE
MRASTQRPVWASSTLVAGAALLVVASAVSSGGKKMTQTVVAQATAAAAGPGPWCVEELLGFCTMTELFSRGDTDVWLCSLAGSIAVGLSGIFPLLIIPIEAGAALKTADGCQKLKKLLSFAIGGLLGDVFLHLLPEAWSHICSPGQSQGLWVILGLLAFLLLEKMFPDEILSPSQTSGYLNLLANCIDNFTHGLAVAGSFLVSRKVSEAGLGGA